MSVQPKRPYFGSQTRAGRVCTSSFKDLSGVVIDFISQSYRINGGYIINKNRDVFAKVETYREYIEEENKYMTYAAVDYLKPEPKED